ncbi:MAG: phytanoyl-CoA dioxygenase family protein [Sphingomonadaceae bacterium]|nr:phytanoyl-CoA dioxygenase family protein [Sphingomonadaceae bacterium]
MEGVTPLSPVSASEPGEAAQALRRDGVVVIADLWPRGVMEQVAMLVSAAHPEFADKASLTDLFDNGKGRFIAPITISVELLETGVLAHPVLEQVLEDTLGPGFLIEAFGMLMAEAGCPAQEPHRDGGLLFPETGLDRLLPPASVTVAIPLVDVGAENGPTAFRPGSHRFDEAAEQAEPVVPLIPLGSAAIWDFRVLHHGCANRSEAPRPVLYLTASRPFWFDHKNFGEGNRRLVADADVIADLGARFARAERA